MTAWYVDDQPNSVMGFRDVKLANGIRNLDSLQTNGIFTCEKAGLYLVAAYSQSDSDDGAFDVYKNDKKIADAAFSRPTYYQTVTAIVSVSLNTNDKVYVKKHRNFHDYPKFESCLTIIQLT